MTGLDLQRELKVPGQAILIIFMTAHKEPGARKRALEQGAVRFLQKPFGETVLLEAVNAEAIEGCYAMNSELGSDLRFTRHLAVTPARLEASMDSLFSFAVELLYPYNMSVHPGALRMADNPGETT